MYCLTKALSSWAWQNRCRLLKPVGSLKAEQALVIVVGMFCSNRFWNSAETAVAARPRKLLPPAVATVLPAAAIVPPVAARSSDSTTTLRIVLRRPLDWGAPPQLQHTPWSGGGARPVKTGSAAQRAPYYSSFLFRPDLESRRGERGEGGITFRWRAQAPCLEGQDQGGV